MFFVLWTWFVFFDLKVCKVDNGFVLKKEIKVDIHTLVFYNIVVEKKYLLVNCFEEEVLNVNLLKVFCV